MNEGPLTKRAAFPKVKDSKLWPVRHQLTTFSGTIHVHTLGQIAVGAHPQMSESLRNQLRDFQEGNTPKPWQLGHESEAYNSDNSKAPATTPLATRQAQSHKLEENTHLPHIYKTLTPAKSAAEKALNNQGIKETTGMINCEVSYYLSNEHMHIDLEWNIDCSCWGAAAESPSSSPQDGESEPFVLKSLLTLADYPICSLQLDKCPSIYVHLSISHQLRSWKNTSDTWFWRGGH